MANTLTLLGILYYQQGQYGLAEPLYQRAIRIRERSLGIDHTFVADTLELYAELLMKTDRVTEASRLLTRARSIRERAK